MVKLIAFECEDTADGLCCTSHSEATAKLRVSFTTWLLLQMIYEKHCAFTRKCYDTPQPLNGSNYTS